MQKIWEEESSPLSQMEQKTDAPVGKTFLLARLILVGMHGAGLCQIDSKTPSSELVKCVFESNKSKTKEHADFTEKTPHSSAFHHHTSSPSNGPLSSKTLKRSSKIAFSQTKRCLRHPRDHFWTPSINSHNSPTFASL